jgi:hypothetical protein
MDIRQTGEARRRALAVSDLLHLAPPDMLAEEIGMAP